MNEATKPESKSASSDRNELASDRTLLANERTLAAWWRTVMTALAAAIGFAQIFGHVGPEWLVRSGATCLVLLAYALLGIGYERYEATARRIEAVHVTKISRWSLWLGTGLLAIVGAVAGAAVWL
jgi:putative membrane protein